MQVWNMIPIMRSQTTHLFYRLGLVVQTCEGVGGMIQFLWHSSFFPFYILTFRACIHPWSFIYTFNVGHLSTSLCKD